MTQKKKAGTLKIRHRRAVGFTSVYSSGVISSYLPSTELFNLTFYEDVVGVNSETVDNPEEDTSTVSFQEGDLEPHREDKVRVSIPVSTAVSLQRIIRKRLDELGVEYDER